MADKKHLNDQELNALFNDAAADSPAVSGDLMARILSDATELAPAAPTIAATMPQRQTLLGRILNSIGGWKPAAGLALATVAGLMFGYVTPDTLDAVASGTFLSADSLVDDFLPSFDDLLSEG